MTISPNPSPDISYLLKTSSSFVDVDYNYRAAETHPFRGHLRVERFGRRNSGQYKPEKQTPFF
jgi:hypothetical protein